MVPTIHSNVIWAHRQTDDEIAQCGSITIPDSRSLATFVKWCSFSGVCVCVCVHGGQEERKEIVLYMEFSKMLLLTDLTPSQVFKMSCRDLIKTNFNSHKNKC